LTINVLTPGYIPNIYLFRNDVLNNSLSFNNLRYPTITNSSIKQENFFFNADGRRTYTVIFNNTAINSTIPIAY